MLFHVEARNMAYSTLREVIALNAHAALAVYREFMSEHDVAYISLSIAVQHGQWPHGQIASQVALLQYGYNGENSVAHWRQIKHWKSEAFARRWPHTRNW